MHTSVFLVSSYLQSGVACCACLSNQQEEALIFSETSGSDLATRKRSRPPPRRIKSTALYGTNGRKRREKDRVWLPDAQQKREDNMASLSELRPIKVINRLKRLTAVVSNVESLLIVIEVSDNSVVSFISV